MGYGFKYSTSDIDNTLRKGNATTTAGHTANPSNNFHSGIAVVSGKHTVAKVFSSAVSPVMEVKLKFSTISCSSISSAASLEQPINKKIKTKKAKKMFNNFMICFLQK